MAVTIKSLAMRHNLLPQIAVIDDDSTAHFILECVARATDPKIKLLPFLKASDALVYLNENSSRAVHLPDIIFLDLQMPVIDGWMFLERFATIKNQFVKEIEIYLLSSSIDSSDMSRAQSSVLLIDFIHKPMTIEKMQKCLVKSEYLKPIKK